MRHLRRSTLCGEGKGFDSVSTAEWDRLKNVGRKATLKNTSIKVMPSYKTILVYKKPKFNCIDLSYKIIDSTNIEDYINNQKIAANTIYETFEVQLPNSTIDTSFYDEKISGLLFHVFKMTINISENKVVELLSYNRIFGDKDFNLNISSTDKENQKLLIDAWRNSKFEID